jgi:hypothetical protein
MNPHLTVEPLEPRQLFQTTPLVDLLVDSNRDGVLTAADDLREDVWSTGRSGRGAAATAHTTQCGTCTARLDRSDRTIAP